MHDQHPRDDSPPRRAAPRRRLGLDGLSALKSALGGPPSPWELESSWLGPGRVDFALVAGARRFEAALTRGPAGGVRLEARGAPEPGAEERALALDLERALAGARLAGLLAALGRDALLYSDPRGGAAPSRFESYYRVVDHEAEFWRFVHPQARFLEQQVDFGCRYVQVSHATLECRLNNPLLSIAPLRFFADEERVRPAGEYGYVDTAISEADVLGGRTQELLGRALETAAREEKPAFIHLKTTCLPELVGDSPAPFLRRVEGELGVPVLWTSKTRDPGPAYARMVERVLDAGGSAGPRDPRAVLLAGVPTPEAGAEAAALLASLGLRVVGSLFPRLDPRAAAGLGAASAVVWLNPVGWEKIDDAVFLRRGLRVARGHPPFGLAGTRAWLERAASALGVPDAAAALARLELARPAGLDAAIAAARGRAVALAGSPAEVELLTSRGGAFGFSVAALLGELGFDVRCLVHSGGARAQDLRRARAPSGAGTIEFAPFATPRELDRELARVDLAFSHFNRDPRLEARGLLGFTEKVFEPGLDGLLRSARRLLARCAGRPFPGRRALLAEAGA